MASRWDRSSWRFIAWLGGPFADAVVGDRGRAQRWASRSLIVVGIAAFVALVGWGVLQPYGKMPRAEPSAAAEIAAIVAGAVVGAVFGLVAISMTPTTRKRPKRKD